MFPIIVLTMLLGAPPAAIQADTPSFDQLVSRVKVGQLLRVEDTSGEATLGKLTALTREALTVEADTGERRLSADAVSTVSVRRTWAGWGTLIGFGAGAVIGYVTDPAYHDWDLPALLGAGGGAIVGHFIPRMKTVYVAPGPRKSLGAGWQLRW